MLTKPLTHLRPLLRLPSHSSPTPDHFSSNPSLLHHLPGGGSSSQSLVAPQQAFASGSTSGHAGASGRAGWSAGGGGYTGHARAFMSLTHNGSVDPSSSMAVTSDDNRTARHHLLLKHRLAKRTQLMAIEDEQVGRSVHRQIEARSGQRLGIVDIQPMDEHYPKTIEDEPSASTSRRRSSIAFPAPTPSTPRRIESPVPSRTASPNPVSTPRGISRSQSNLEIWNVGIPQPRHISARHMSTAPDRADRGSEEDTIDFEIVKKTPPPSTRILGQPNRVLLDLAGLDLPGVSPRAPPLARRNSTAAIQQTQKPEEDQEAEVPKISADLNVKRGRAIEGALIQATKEEDVDRVNTLIQHYRSPRNPSAFSEPPESRLATSLPLPEGFSTHTYTQCLQSLMNIRQPGHSIAPILEIYNEMLERGCVPISKTYSLIIRALCQREIDVSKAVAEFEHQKKLELWKADRLNIEVNAAELEQKEAVIQGYRAEKNIESALKLWRASILALGPRRALQGVTYKTLCEALASSAPYRESGEQGAEGITDILEYAQSQNLNGARGLIQFQLEALGKAGKGDELTTVWKTFEKEDLEGSKSSEAEWLYHPEHIESGSPNEIRNQRCRTWLSGAEAFLSVGNVEQALDIASRATDPEGQKNHFPRWHSYDRHGFVEALGQADIQAAIEWFEANVRGKTNSFAFLQKWVETLLRNDQWSKAVEVYKNKVMAEHTIRTSPSLFVTSGIDQIMRHGAAPNDIFTTLSQLLGETHRYTWDVDQMTTLLSHLANTKQYHHVVDALSLFRVPAHDDVIPFYMEIILTSQNDISTRDLANLIAFIWKGDAPTETASLALAQNYLVSRGKVSSANELGLHPGHWRMMVRAFAEYPGNEPDLDDALIKFSEDLGELINENGDSLDLLPNHAEDVLQYAGKLVHRFGRERAVELLTRPFGKQQAEAFTATEEEAPEEQSVFNPPPSPSNIPQHLPNENGLIIDRELSHYVRSHTASRSGVSVWDSYNALQDGLGQGRVADPESLALLFDNIARTGDEIKTREVYSVAQYVIHNLVPVHLRQQSWYIVENAMLIATCHLGHLEEAGMFRARIVETGMPPTADAYATMIACSKDTTDDALVARELFDESRAAGVKPNLYLYNTIISKLSRARKAEMALDLFKHMKATGVRPSSVTYGAVINACCRVGDGESAAVLFEEMTSHQDFRPRVPPFNTMMQFHLTTQPSREKVLYYYGEMQRYRVAPSAHTYKLLLDAYAVLPPVDFTSMNRTFEKLVADRKEKVQGTHWASLISAYGIYAGNVEQALRIFNSIPTHRGGRVDLAQEPVVWEAILNVLAQKGTIAQLEDVRQKMIQSGAKATAYVYNVLISGYARAGQIEKARETFESMGDSVVGVAAPNNHPTLLTSSGHVKPSTVTDIPTGLVYREPSTYEAMIRAELLSGSREGAEEVCKRMEARRYPVAVYLRARALLDDHSIKSATLAETAPSIDISANQRRDINYDASRPPKQHSSGLAPESSQVTPASERVLSESERSSSVSATTSEQGSVETGYTTPPEAVQAGESSATRAV